MSPVSLWERVSALVDSWGGLTVDEALDAAERQSREPQGGEM